MERLFIGLLLAAFAAVVFWATGPVMRETDQASLIGGAWQLKEGVEPRGADFHVYDKQFLSYALAGVIVGEVAAPLTEIEIHRLVEQVNRLAALTFVMGLGIFVGCLEARRSRCRGVIVPLLVFVSAPVVLLSAPLVSSALISAGFLLALAGVLVLKRFSFQPWLAGMLAFLAVAARADAVLCFPTLCWATVRGTRWNALFRSPTHWSMAAGAMAALLVGRGLARGGSPTIYERFLEPEVLLTYLVFGLGGLLLLGAGFVVLSGRRIGKRRGFWMAGLVFLALPLAFYGWQLFSPRHLMTTALNILIATTGWRGRALWRLEGRVRPRFRSTGAVATGLLAVASLFAGLHRPAPDQRRVVMSEPTRFPTADGLWPMGATLSFLVQLKLSPEVPLDHNQAIWNAAIGDEVRWPDVDPVPVLETPMRRYLTLALRLSGRDPVLAGVTHEETWKQFGWAVSDERSLRTLNPGQVNPAGLNRYETWLAGLKGARLEVITPERGGHTLVWLSQSTSSNPPGDPLPDANREFEVRRVLAVALNNEEFHLAGELPSGDAIRLSRSQEGRTLAFSSHRPFAVDGVAAHPVTDLAGSAIYALVIPGEATIGKRQVDLDSAEPVSVWTMTLPDYMSRNRFRSDRGSAASRGFDRWLPKEIAARFGNSEARDASVR